MPILPIEDWCDEQMELNVKWFAKRLSGNDTLANKSHQAGPYIPNKFLFTVFPNLSQSTQKNPDVWFDLFLDSHADLTNARAVWYNNKFFGGTRNEIRLTNLGGQNSALLDPESTGALTVFAFHLDKKSVAYKCHSWVCSNSTEEDFIEDLLGIIEPGTWETWPKELNSVSIGKDLCWLTEKLIPPDWLAKYPKTEEIISKVLEIKPELSLPPDSRILRRRECEFQIFQSLEEIKELPRIQTGFQTMSAFVQAANSILQRRKSRSGRSLELHAKVIMEEEGLIHKKDFSHQCKTEDNKKPDFLFPTEKSYHDEQYSASKLRMLAVKTTCKDRWRQILNEAERIETKHLLTLQEGVSENQFSEMSKANVKLVVPEKLHKFYPKSVQPNLITFGDFIADIHISY